MGVRVVRDASIRRECSATSRCSSKAGTLEFIILNHTNIEIKQMRNAVIDSQELLCGPLPPNGFSAKQSANLLAPQIGDRSSIVHLRNALKIA